MIKACLLLSGALTAITSAVAESSPAFPRQFSASVSIYAHQVDASKPYPPHLKRMRIYIDTDAQRARADVLAGHDEGKRFFRLYGQKQEFMVREGDFAECRRSYLGEAMPLSEFPADAVREGEEVVDGERYLRYVSSPVPESRVTILVDPRTMVPMKLVEEYLDRTREEGAWVKLITYEVSDVVASPPDGSLFQVPASRDECARHIGGFPYIHAFSHWLRF